MTTCKVCETTIWPDASFSDGAADEDPAIHASCFAKTMTELVVEVDRQKAEYDIDTSTAVENVADALGAPWLATWTRYWAAKDASRWSTP